MKFISRINEVVAKYTCWLLIVLIGILVFDVIARYLFNSPTLWAYDLAWMINGAFFILGAGYTLKLNEHTRVEVTDRYFSERTKTIIEIISYLILFFPFMFFMFVASSKYAYRAWVLSERSPYTFWRPLTGPIRTILAIGILLLLLQGIEEFVGLVKRITRGGNHGS